MPEVPERPAPPPDRFTPAGRALAAGWLAALAGGFGLARWLEPAAAGLGTHQQLGLPPCTVRVLLGVRCPSCGMTTSFAHFTRGAWFDSAAANAGGFALALFCVGLTGWLAASVWRGRPVRLGAGPGVRGEWVLAAGLGAVGGISLADWAVRVMW